MVAAVADAQSRVVDAGTMLDAAAVDRQSRERQTWRRSTARRSLRSLCEAAAVDEKEIIAEFTKASRKVTAEMNEALRTSKGGADQVRDIHTQKYMKAITDITTKVTSGRDRLLIQALAQWPKVEDGLHNAQRLGLLAGEWLDYTTVENAIASFRYSWPMQKRMMQANGTLKDVLVVQRGQANADNRRSAEAEATLSTLAMRMAASLQRRQYSLMQKCSLDIDASRKNAMDNRIAPGPYVFPPAKGILTAGDVKRLREGEALVLDPPDIFTDEMMQRAHADLTRIEATVAADSKSPCNTGSRSTHLPLLMGCDPRCDG